MIKRIVAINIGVFLLLNLLEETINSNVPIFLQWIIVAILIFYGLFKEGKIKL